LDGGDVDGWVCLVVGGSDHDRMVAEVTRIFGDDLVEVRVVTPLDDSSESYCLVRCRDYLPHVGELMSSSVVRAALPSYERPQPLTDEEVEEFCLSMEPKASKRPCRGDLVRVLDGYLSGLFGIVAGPGKGDGWRVLFRFHVKDFEEELMPLQLEILDNVFRSLKMPVTSDTVDERGMRVMAQAMGEKLFMEYMVERRGINKVRGKES